MYQPVNFNQKILPPFVPERALLHKCFATFLSTVNFVYCRNIVRNGNLGTQFPPFIWAKSGIILQRKGLRKNLDKSQKSSNKSRKIPVRPKKRSSLQFGKIIIFLKSWKNTPENL